ncbi:hypothetical protein VNO77_46961 [Canavalia gladiata]|uniref:Uncharacterized protein n=1 Tax=Canavalia gladiata TaxID=3824 RepID=A0AAN9JG27_CANGL
MDGESHIIESNRESVLRIGIFKKLPRARSLGLGQAWLDNGMTLGSPERFSSNLSFSVLWGARGWSHLPDDGRDATGSEVARRVTAYRISMRERSRDPPSVRPALQTCVLARDIAWLR